MFTAHALCQSKKCRHQCSASVVQCITSITAGFSLSRSLSLSLSTKEGWPCEKQHCQVLQTDLEVTPLAHLHLLRQVRSTSEHCNFEAETSPPPRRMIMHDKLSVDLHLNACTVPKNKRREQRLASTSYLTPHYTYVSLRVYIYIYLWLYIPYIVLGHLQPPGRRQLRPG